MSLKRLVVGTSLAGLTLLSATASAGAEDRLKASCIMTPAGEIEGTNKDQLVEIASVSKVLTAHWVVKKLGAHKRFVTKVQVTPSGEDAVDIHISGGMDPLFSKNKLQLMVSELNKLGFEKVNRLTFDENFRYAESIREGANVANNPAYTVLGKNGIIKALRKSVENINTGYSSFRTFIQKKAGITMDSRLKFSVTDIDGLASKDYVAHQGTRVFLMNSAEAHVLLKEMNRRSNNYIANIAFNAMGDANEYKTFIQKELGMDERDLMIGNGSGYPMRIDEKRFDNRATCSAVVRIIKDLRTALMAEGLRLGDVMAVAGSDSTQDKASTTTAIYKNETTDDALVAKTGTSDPVVTLAGAASTHDGVIYFGVMVKDGTPRRAASGRAIIAKEILNLFKRFGGAEEIKFIPRPFALTDKENIFVEVTEPKLK